MKQRAAQPPLRNGANKVASVAHLGGLTRRRHPTLGMRPTVRFAVASTLTAAYVAFAVNASQGWRGDLEQAIGPVMSWVIPLMLAYIPSVLIGFLAFTLLTTRYRAPALVRRRAHGRRGNGPRSH